MIGKKVPVIKCKFFLNNLLCFAEYHTWSLRYALLIPRWRKFAVTATQKDRAYKKTLRTYCIYTRKIKLNNKKDLKVHMSAHQKKKVQIIVQHCRV